MKILVVDDHPLIQEALTQLLPQLRDDIEVLNAVTADEATGILDDEPEVSLVLLDLALPGTRGLDLLADLMQDYPGRPPFALRWRLWFFHLCVQMQKIVPLCPRRKVFSLVETAAELPESLGGAMEAPAL